MIPLVGNIQKRQIDRDSKWISVCLRLEWEQGLPVNGHEGETILGDRENVLKLINGGTTW